MAEETEPEVVVDDAEAGAAPEGRANVATANWMQSILRVICPASGQKMALYVTNPGTSGGTPSTGYVALNWTNNPTGGGATAATITAPAVQFTGVAANTGGQSYGWYGVFDASNTFLYGKPLTPAVQVPSGATGTITVTATHSYDIN